MLFTSASMLQVVEQARRFARSSAPVLILGESGVGKEVIARLIHEKGPRAGRPYVTVNCAALSENLIESELFGHDAGAFTGAVQARTGRLEAAADGSLLLDEAGELSLAIQAKLLRVLEEQEFERVGSNQLRSFQGRIIAATNKDLTAEVRDGRFRLDLFHRLGVLPLYVPPLRERPDDLLPLAEMFLARFQHESPDRPESFSPAAVRRLQEHNWPGNVRELRNVIQRACVLAEAAVIDSSDLIIMESPANPRPNAPQTLDRIEREAILSRLRIFDGNKSRAAEDLGVTPRTLRNKLRQYRETDRAG